jgi:hypothetical protein
MCSIFVLHVGQNDQKLGFGKEKLFMEVDIIKVCHPPQSSTLDGPSSRQTQKPTRLCNPAAHPQQYVTVHVCGLHGAKHILYTAAGECERFDRSSERPGMRHENKFEVFARAAHAVLHAGLLHCSEEFVWRTETVELSTRKWLQQ